MRRQLCKNSRNPPNTKFDRENGLEKYSEIEWQSVTQRTQLSSARNFGISRATFSYITILSAKYSEKQKYSSIRSVYNLP